MASGLANVAGLFLLMVGVAPFVSLASQPMTGNAALPPQPARRSHLFHTAKQFCADNASYNATFDEEYWLRNWPEVCPTDSWLHTAKWLPHVLDEQGYLSICISLDFGEPHVTNASEIEEMRAFTEEMVYWWQLSLIGTRDWRHDQRIPVKIFGVAMTSNVTLPDSIWTTYVNDEASCPESCKRSLFEEWQDLRGCSQSGNHFDLSVVTDSSEAIDWASNAADRNIRVPWRTLESEMRGSSTPRVTLREIGHAAGLRNVPSLSVQSSLASIFLESPTPTAFDCAMLRSLWAQHDPRERQHRRCHGGLADGVADGCKACSLCKCGWNPSDDSVPCASYCADKTLLRPTTTTTTSNPDGLAAAGYLAAASACRITLVSLIIVLAACTR